MLIIPVVEVEVAVAEGVAVFFVVVVENFADKVVVVVVVICPFECKYVKRVSM